jgi:hypothetical protein
MSRKQRLAVVWAGLSISVLCAGMSAQSRQVVCDRGVGHFETTFRTGVIIDVGAVANGGFSSRACQAVLNWGNGRTVAVQTAAQVDIDVLGADLGLGEPVVAFEVRQTQDDWRTKYEIWSLQKKPHLLLELTGGDRYRTVDAGFNRQTAIWTTDAVAVQGFEGLTHADLPFSPTMVLQFDRSRMVDVSAWYRPEYDGQIAKLREGLTREALAQFRKSDGRLERELKPTADHVNLKKTKITVLEIVWAYLYSGRSELAWAELADAWPPEDVSRIKAAIVATRAQGIEAQVNRIASDKHSPKWMERPFVYEYLKPGESGDQIDGVPTYNALGTAGPGAVSVKSQGYDSQRFEADVEPKPILLWRPPPSTTERTLVQREETVLLTIDAAGKVESAKMVVPMSDPELLQAATNWKFMPAMRDGKPVAYKMKMDVGLIR